VREAVVASLKAEFTGVTCVMGAAPLPRPVRGICFPSSSTTKNHGCYYPTGDGESIFQLYFPAKTMDDAWGTLSAEEGRQYCAELADRLTADGWHADLVTPLRHAQTVIRLGIFAREPLERWVGGGGRIVLVGDAAHPPVPYIGQGAMMAMEDVGVLALLLRHHCCAGGQKPFAPTEASLAAVSDDYQGMRIARTRHVLGNSHKLGATQQKRADSWIYNLQREWAIRLQVMWYGTLPIMRPGAAYDYAADVDARLTGPPPASAAEGAAEGGAKGGGVAVLCESKTLGRLVLLGATVATATLLLRATRR